MYAGAEIGYTSKGQDEILRQLEDKKFDYTVCSVHRSLGYSLSTGQKRGVF